MWKGSVLRDLCTRHVQCTCSVHVVYTTFTLHVHYMYTTCILHLHYLYTTCTLRAVCRAREARRGVCWLWE